MVYELKAKQKRTEQWTSDHRSRVFGVYLHGAVGLVLFSIDEAGISYESDFKGRRHGVDLGGHVYLLAIYAISFPPHFFWAGAAPV